MAHLQLVSHKLCPYVQRAIIALIEKDVPFERLDIDLADKPAWFLTLSPLGKTPVLVADGEPVFESAVILEYLEETQQRPLHPREPLARAQHRSWIEFGSAVLSDIAGLYSAADAVAFHIKREALQEKFARLEAQLGEGPFFSGKRFSLVDTVFGPVFRYIDCFERIDEFGLLEGKPKTAAWREALGQRVSIKAAVVDDYPLLLWRFLERRQSYLTSLMSRRVS